MHKMQINVKYNSRDIDYLLAIMIRLNCNKIGRKKEKMKLNKKGFTLIELLAVIVIIAIIALIAIPAFMAIMNNSRKDTIRTTALNMLNAGVNQAASHGRVAEESPCVISWDQLEMASDTLPGGRRVDTANSFVVFQSNATGEDASRVVLVSDTPPTPAIGLPARTGAGPHQGMTRAELTGNTGDMRRLININLGNDNPLSTVTRPTQACW